MLDTAVFHAALKSLGVSFFTGVPDSLLADFCAYVDDNVDHSLHHITANEGNAIAVAMGYQMATSTVPVVYMQNSGLGNAINPLASLCDPEVYSIPLLLMIGWRGEPGISDEPQHVKQGKITKGQLELLGIPYHVIDANTDLSQVIVQVAGELATRSAPVALLVRKGTFAPYHSRRDHRSRSSLMREAAIHQILALCSGDELLVATTGKTSRELCEARIARGELPEDFLSVGGMGHVSSLAFGVALGKPGRRVICLDGDGSLLMHMGSMAVIGAKRPANLLHVLLNNEAHESVGGQPTAASDIEFRGLAKATGYRNFFSVSTAEELASAWPEACAQSGPTFLEIRISCGSRSNLGRPKLSPEQNKHGFIRTMTKHR